MVDLVAGRLDQHGAFVGRALAKGGLDDDWMGGADGGQPDFIACRMALRQVEQDIAGHGSLTEF